MTEDPNRPYFDREKISHVTNPAHGYALVNGCQGIFVDSVCWDYEQALKQWVENGGFKDGDDEQIVRVAVSIIHDFGRPEDAEHLDDPTLGTDPHFTTERFSKPCGCREASCLCNVGAEQRAAFAMIDAFAFKMKDKFVRSKALKGKTGWDEENWSWSCWRQMRAHCAKGDPVDVALFSAFAWNMSPDAEASADSAVFMQNTGRTR
jgi:hypothetical protein